MIAKRTLVLATMVLLVAGAAQAQWTNSGGNAVLADLTKNVGIGTNSPGSRVHVTGNTTVVSAVQVTPTMTGNAGATNIGLQIAPTQSVAADLFAGINAQVDQAGAASGTVGSLIGLAAVARHWDAITVTDAIGARYGIANRGTGTITNAYGARILSATNSGGGAITNQYGLYIDNMTGAATNYAIFVAGGLVHLGSNLNVAGDVTAGGNLAAKYQDVAEWVPSTEFDQLPYGTVVVIDPSATNHVVRSTSEYSTAVAGIISERPGLALGEASKSKVLVATTGRVKAKVDASKGAINIGDLLVTSDKPGVAMKSQPIEIGGAKIHRPGTVVGKALESLEKGQGEILVLLTLQ